MSHTRSIAALRGAAAAAAFVLCTGAASAGGPGVGRSGGGCADGGCADGSCPHVGGLVDDCADGRCPPCADVRGHRAGGGLVPEGPCRDGRCRPGNTRPVGTRQVCAHDKLWPPYPRPAGEKATFSTQFHAAHYWPWPYNCWDKAAVREFSNAQVARGWQEHLTLYPYHFDAATGELNAAGTRQLGWMLRSGVAEGRGVAVAVGGDRAAGQRRAGRVRAALGSLGADDLAARVALLDVPVPSRSADEIDVIRRGELSSMPVPRVLPQTGGGAEGGG